MSEQVTIIIPLYGDLRVWGPRAMRALASAQDQESSVTRLVLGKKGEDLADVRNRGAQESRTPWLIFLDASDELEPGYTAAMLAGEGDIRVPKLRWCYQGVEAEWKAPYYISPPPHPYEFNWIPIGAMIGRHAFHAVGGFQHVPAWEDWLLWLMLQVNGAVAKGAGGAVYRAYRHENSRNNSIDDPAMLKKNITGRVAFYARALNESGVIKVDPKFMEDVQ